MNTVLNNIKTAIWNKSWSHCIGIAEYESSIITVDNIRHGNIVLFTVKNNIIGEFDQYLIVYTKGIEK